MSNFITDTKDIDAKIKLDLEQTTPTAPLVAAFLPYYVDPKSMKLMVLLKREVLKGGFVRTGRKMGITCLTTILPEGSPITIEEAFKTLNVPATVQDTIPFGSVMLDPKNSDSATELVLAQIEPVEFLDEGRGIVFQQKGEYEIGAIEFDALLEAVQENFIQDITTRFMLSELYIMAMEEANKQGEGGNSMFEQGGNTGGIVGGEENPEQYGKIDFTDDTEVTEEIPEDILAQNADMNFGAMYKN